MEAFTSTHCCRDAAREHASTPLLKSKCGVLVCLAQRDCKALIDQASLLPDRNMHFSLSKYAVAATHFYSKPLLLLHHSCAQNVLQCRQGALARTCFTSDNSLDTSSSRRTAVVVRAVAEAGRDASSTAKPGSKSPVVNKAKKKFAKKHPSKQQIKQQLKLKDKKKTEQHHQQQQPKKKAKQKQMQQQASHQPQLSQEQRQQQAGEPQVQQTDAGSAASAAAAAIQAANQLLQPAGASVQPTPASSNSNSSSTAPQQFSDKVAGISYVLDETHRAAYRAAGARGMLPCCQPPNCSESIPDYFLQLPFSLNIKTRISSCCVSVVVIGQLAAGGGAPSSACMKCQRNPKNGFHTSCQTVKLKPFMLYAVP